MKARADFSVATGTSAFRATSCEGAQAMSEAGESTNTRESQHMTIKFTDRGITRRRLLQGAAIAGAAAAVGPRYSLAEGGSVLRVRSYADIQNLDPAHRTSQPDGDVMG